MFLVFKSDLSAFLCQDGEWRGDTSFGTYSDCVKEYRTKGHAVRRAKRLKGVVVEVPQGVTISRARQCYNDESGKLLLASLVVWKLEGATR